MMRHIVAVSLSAALLLGAFAGCSEPQGMQLDRDNPQLLTFCHSYNGQLQKALDELIVDFNDSYGEKNGIAVRAIAVDAVGRDELLGKILVDAEDAPAMPDLVAVSRGMGRQLLDAGLIVELDSRFPDEKLEELAPQFVDQGRLPDGRLYLLPIALTTEILFVNRHLFEQFAPDSGTSLEALAAMEGIGEAAAAYYHWTDAQTTDTLEDGATFFAATSLLNQMAAGTAQLGDPLATDIQSLGSNAFQRVWQNVITPGLTGGYTADRSPSRLLKDERIVCYTGPVSDITLYSNYQLATMTALPYPVMQGGELVAPLVGDAVAVASSTPEKEFAAVQFLSWLTETKHNERLTSASGYLPVADKALGNAVGSVPKSVSDETTKTALEILSQMYTEYNWVIPLFEDSTTQLAGTMENSLHWLVRSGRQRALAGEAVPALDTELIQTFAAHGGDLSSEIAAAASISEHVSEPDESSDPNAGQPLESSDGDSPLPEDTADAQADGDAAVSPESEPGASDTEEVAGSGEAADSSTAA